MSGKAVFIDPQRDIEQLAELQALQRVRDMRFQQNVRTDRDAHTALHQSELQGIDFSKPLNMQTVQKLNDFAGREQAADRYLQNSVLKDIDFDRS